jgi:hypothetical protein
MSVPLANPFSLTWKPSSCVVRSRPPWSQVARKLTSHSPFPPHSLPIPFPFPPPSNFPSPRGFPKSTAHPTKTTSRSRLHIVRNTPLVMLSSLHTQTFVVFPGLNIAPSSASAPAVDPSFPWPLGHHEYFFFKSSKLMLFFPVSFSSDSRASSVSIICPTLTPTFSIAASTQLKGEIANWERVTQKAVSTRMPHPLHLFFSLYVFWQTSGPFFTIFSSVATHRGQPAAKCHPCRWAISCGLGRRRIQTRYCRTTVWGTTIEPPRL